ncbi:MAG: DUF4296 domain-containing protein [Aquirufa sp.]
MYKYIFLFLPFLFSCSETKQSSTLPEAKMIQILVDIHLTEGKVNAMHLGTVDSSLVVYNYFEKQVFKKHGIDSTRFVNSLNDYIKEPKAFKELYKKVFAQLDEQSNARNKSMKPL